MIILYRRQYRKVLRTEADLEQEIKYLDQNYDTAAAVEIEFLMEYFGCCAIQLKCERDRKDITMGSA